MNKTIALLTALSLTTLSIFASPTPIAIAGDLLVDLNAGDLTSIGEGNEVNLWTNNGTTPDFKSLNGTGGPTFELRDNVPTVRFNNTPEHCMTNGAFGSLPPSILGTNTWSIEAWVYREGSGGGTTIFSWTPRDGVDSPAGKSMELRYLDPNNTVEHHGSGYNIPWGGYPNSTVPPPPYGAWHHLVATRDATGRERLYCNGHIVTEDRRPNTNLADDGTFVVGGVYSRTKESPWDHRYQGDISQIRVHSDTLTPEDVLTNYQLDNTRYNRANEQDALWTGTWINSVQPASGRGLIIDSDPDLDDPAIINTSLDLTTLRPDSGSLTITDGADITLAPFPTRLSFGYAGSHFNLYLANGSLTTTSFSTTSADRYINFGYGTDATATVVVGDGTNPAAITHDYDIALAANLGTTATMTIRNAATVTTGHRLRIGDQGGHGILNIEAGGTLVSSSPLVGARAATGEVYVAGMLIASNSRLEIGENSESATVTLLPGGTISATAITPFNSSSYGSLILDGGTIVAPPNDARSAFISGNLDITLTDNGVTFDIQIDKQLTVSTPIIEDPNYPGGTITKTGIGTLVFAAENEISGDIIVSDGALILQPGALPPGYNSTILLENNAAIAMPTASGANTLISLLDTASIGILRLYDINAAENIDLSSHPGISLQYVGTEPLTGTVTPYQNHYRFAPTATYTFNQVIADQPGYPAKVTLASPTAEGELILGGNNSDMSGGIVVESGTLTLAQPSAAGSTNTKDVELRNGTSLKLSATMDADFIDKRITDNSDPLSILLASANADYNLDISRFPGCFVSTDENNLTYTGTITPANNTYLLGGGRQNHVSQPHTGFQLDNLTDAPDSTPRSAVIGLPGIVQLKEGNSYSGGTVVTNDGVLFLTSDGLGAIPATPDPTNLTIDGGILRPGNANTTLPATRGLHIGTEGAIIHPWTTYTTTILGNLSGSGKITINDGGNIVFGGSDNTYSGSISHSSSRSTLTIGAGDTFSWNPSAPITTTGTVLFNNNFDTTFAGTISGSGSIAKQGSGNLTLTQPQQITGTVTIQDGDISLKESGSFANAKYLSNMSSLIFDNQTGQYPPIGLSGFGTVTVKGSGTSLHLDGASSMNPGWVKAENGGTLAAFSPSALGAAPVILSSGNLQLSTANITTLINGFTTADWQLNRNHIEATAIFVEVDDETQLQLTPASGSAAGTAWHKVRVPHATRWEVEFDYLTGTKSSIPADGFAFVLQNALAGTAVIGSSGGALGVDSVTPSIGIYVNIYNTDSMGWIVNGTKTGGMINLLGGTNELEDGDVHFKLTYDGTTLSVTISKGTRSYTNTREFDLSNALGSDYSWLGFTGATGGSIAEQRIANFNFKVVGEESLNQALNDENWQRNGHSEFVDVNDETVLEMTNTDDTFRVSSNWLRQKVNLAAPFTITSRFWVGDKSSTPADGFAFGFQNSGLEKIGSAGSSAGFKGISDAIGWIIAFYTGGGQKQRMFWHEKGADVAGYTVDTLADNNISLHSGEEVFITMQYDLQHVTMTLTQGENTVSAVSPQIDLVKAFNSLEAWFGVTAGTGGARSQQFITDINLSYDNVAVDRDSYQNPITVEGNSTIAANIHPDGSALSVGKIVLADAATLDLTVAANATPDLAYTFSADNIVVPANGATIAIADNGTGTGTLILDNIEFDTTGTLTLDGNLATNDKVTLQLSEKFNGSRALIDLTTATGLTLTDFELDSPMNGAKLKLKSGILYAVNSDGTVMLLR